jgi:hypothetical protein
MRRLLVLAGTGAALLLAGCTTTAPGTPNAGERPTATPTTTTGTAGPATTTTQDPGVSRPRNIDVTTVDPCHVVTVMPRDRFGLDNDRAPLGGESDVFPDSRDCFNNGITNNLALTLSAVVGQGAAEYAEGAAAEVTQTAVQGFPLYVLTPRSPDSCFGALDVNDGQMLFINYGLATPGGQPATPQATLCERVPQIAEVVLVILVGNR